MIFEYKDKDMEFAVEGELEEVLAVIEKIDSDDVCENKMNSLIDTHKIQGTSGNWDYGCIRWEG